MKGWIKVRCEFGKERDVKLKTKKRVKTYFKLLSSKYIGLLFS